MTPDDKTALLAMADSWQQIAMKCSAVAARHRAKGERLQAIEQEAFATSRRACAEELKRMVEAEP